MRFSSPVPSDAAPVVIDYYSKSGGMPPMLAIVTGFGALLALVMIGITWLYRQRVARGELQR